MGSISVGAPQPWPSPTSSSFSSNNNNNKSYRDCSNGICSLSCPQLCSYLFFPPPPPFDDDFSSSEEEESGGRISPLMAALIATLTAAFLLLFYYTVVSRLFRRRHRRRDSSDDLDIRLDPMVHDRTPPSTGGGGVDESFIRQITVFKYRRGDGLIDGIDCAVCLNEFKEEENLRLMPNCEHAFHIPCIDTWLKSHSNCPLCRSTMEPAAGNGVTMTVSAMQMHRSNGAVSVVVENAGDGHDDELIVCHEATDADAGDSVIQSEELMRKMMKKGVSNSSIDAASIRIDSNLN